MRRSVILLAAAAGIPAAALLWGWARSPLRPNAPRQLAGDRAPASASSALSPAPLAASAESAYRFTRKIRARMGKQELVDLILQGEIWTSTRGADWEHPKKMLLRMQAAEAGRGAPRALPLARITFEDGAPAFEIAAAEAPAAEDEEARDATARFARDLLDQFSFHADADLQGRYEARWREISDRRSEKEKTRYLDGPYAGSAELSSHHSLLLDGNRQLEKLEGTEVLTMGRGDSGLSAESEYLIAAAPDGAPMLAALEKNRRWIAEESPALGKAQGKSRGLASVEAWELEKIPPLQDLLAALKRGDLGEGTERLVFFRQLALRLKSSPKDDPRLTQTMRGMLRDLRDDPEHFKILTSAISSSGQTAADAAMLEAYRDPSYPVEAHGIVMASWTVGDAPISAESEKFLMELASNADTSLPEKQSATLALGAQLLKMDGAASMESKGRIERWLVAQLQQAKTEPDLIAALDGMGNTGDAALFPEIQTHLRNASSAVRAHAYLALRLMPGESISTQLAEGEKDAAEEVRDAARSALRLREASL